MRAISLILVAVAVIPVAVAVIFYVLFGMSRRDDEEGEGRGILGVLTDLLSWW